MKLIRDIICAKTNYDEMYNLNDAYIGKVMVEDGIFEGIVIDPSTHNEIFIFGTIEENEFIELMVAENEEDTIPREYKAVYNGKNYRGDYLAKTAYYEFPLGECQVSVLDPYYYRSTNSGEFVTMENHISHHKDKLNKDTKELYRTIIEKAKDKRKRKVKTTQKMI